MRAIPVHESLLTYPMISVCPLQAQASMVRKGAAACEWLSGVRSFSWPLGWRSPRANDVRGLKPPLSQFWSLSMFKLQFLPGLLNMRNIEKWTEMNRNECTWQMYTNVYKCIQMYTNVYKCIQMYWTVMCVPFLFWGEWRSTSAACSTGQVQNLAKVSYCIPAADPRRCSPKSQGQKSPPWAFGSLLIHYVFHGLSINTRYYIVI